MYPYISILGKTMGTYGVCMVLGFFLAGFLSWRKGKKFGVSIEDILIVAAFALLGALLCGGLLFVFVTYPVEQIIQFIRQGDFSFLASGIVFYGGLIGGVLGALLGIRVARCELRALERAVIPFVPLGHAVGRIGCIMAGCCHGFAYDGPFAIYFPHSVTGLDPDQGYFPIQLLEAVLNCAVCVVLVLLSQKERKTFDLLFTYLGLYAVERFILEFFRGDAVRGIFVSLSTSQWISAFIMATCLGYILLRRGSEKEHR